MDKILFLILVLCTNFCVAQDNFRITYSGKLLSASLSNKLMLEVVDKELLEAYKELIGSYEVFYSLYINSVQNESIFIEEKENGLDGPPPFKSLFAYYKSNQSLYFEDLFRGKKFNVKDRPSNLRWDITNSVMQIGQFKCRKATLHQDPYNTVVWFSEQYPLPYGPYLANGLPGLVVLMENDYYSIKINKISKEPTPSTIIKKMEEASKKAGITLTNYYKEVKPLLDIMRNESIVN